MNYSSWSVKTKTQVSVFIQEQSGSHHPVSPEYVLSAASAAASATGSSLLLQQLVQNSFGQACAWLVQLMINDSGPWRTRRETGDSKRVVRNEKLVTRCAVIAMTRRVKALHDSRHFDRMVRTCTTEVW
jgi:hypothetical protein